MLFNQVKARQDASFCVFGSEFKCKEIISLKKLLKYFYTDRTSMGTISKASLGRLGEAHFGFPLACR